MLHPICTVSDFARLVCVNAWVPAAEGVKKTSTGLLWIRPASADSSMPYCAVDYVVGDPKPNGSVVSLCSGRWSAREEVDLYDGQGDQCGACIKVAQTGAP